jgi:glycosyltransferase involved in cell wall biosynthesis
VSDVFLRASPEGRRPPGTDILYVGGAGPNKNLARLIEAMAVLRRSHPIRLVIAGDRLWDEHELREALGVSPPGWINLCGYMDDRELAELYRSARAVVVPSIHEGFGLPILEAMACGTPVACSRIPPFEEVAHDAACYFDPMNVDDIVSTLERLMKDDELRGRLSIRGRARATLLTWTDSARKTIAVYHQVLARHESRDVTSET